MGLEALCYRLSKLEEVNLCETSIGARGVEALTSLHQLRVVNLNSTRVTMDAYCKLKVREHGLNQSDSIITYIKASLIQKQQFLMNRHQ